MFVARACEQGTDFIPENRMVRWEPQSPPLVQPSGRGCSQSGSGRLIALDMGSYSMASLHGITFTSCPPAASRMALTCAYVMPQRKKTMAIRGYSATSVFVKLAKAILNFLRFGIGI